MKAAGCWLRGASLPSSNAVAKISPVGRPRTWESANATYKGFFSPSESLAVKQFPANNWVDMDQSRRRARIIAADGSKTRAACSPILTWAAFAHQQSSWQSDSWWTPATATKMEVSPVYWSAVVCHSMDVQKNRKLRLLQGGGSLQIEQSQTLELRL